jgi:AraC-like DNA-binding protein
LKLQIRGGTRLPSHTHPVHQVVYAASGVLKVEVGDRRWVVPPQRALVVPAHARHAVAAHTAADLTTLYVRPEMLVLRTPRVIGVQPLLRELLVHAAELGILRDDTPAEARLLGVILDQVRLLPDAPLQLVLPADPRARRVAEWLQKDPADARAVGALARATGASKRTLERLFATETGMSVAQWRQQVRLLSALATLATGESVANVAASVGYSSTSAFITTFKRAFGATPKEYFGPAV